MYQLSPPSTDPLLPSINKYCPILTQYQHVSTITAMYWPSNTKYQPEPPSTDPVPSCINYYRPLLIQYHQVSTSIATYWPSAIIYQPVPPSTDPVPTGTAFYWPSTNLYCWVLGTTDFCTVYPGSCFNATQFDCLGFSWFFDNAHIAFFSRW